MRATIYQYSVTRHGYRKATVMFQFDIAACLILMTVHLLQGIYLRYQLHQVERDGEQVFCQDLQTSQRVNIIRDPIYFTGSYLILFSMTLLVALVWAPLAVGFSAYAVVSWRPFEFASILEEDFGPDIQILDVEEEDMYEAYYPDED